MNNMPPNTNIPVDLLEDRTEHSRSNIVQRYYAWTSLPDASGNASFVQREAVRRSRLSSTVIFFFAVLVFSLLPVTFLVLSIYPYYFWLSLFLFVVCIIALFLNGRGFTNTAGVIVCFGAFLTLSAALFTTLPFDETTLQGYDMFVILLLLSAALLPLRMIAVFFVLCVCVIIGSLLKMPLTPTLQGDLNSRLIIILARPIGILFMGSVLIYIITDLLNKSIQRANRAEAIARLEHEQAQFRQELEMGIEQILQTHVQVSNGNYSARAPLSEHGVLWQIARALNNLLVRFQRAVAAEQDLKGVQQTVNHLVSHIQQDKMTGKKTITLPFTRNEHLDPLIAELQGQQIEMTRPEAATPNSKVTRAWP